MELNDTTPPREIRTSYLVAGLILLGIAGLWAARAADWIQLDSVGWLFPLVLVVAGAAGLIAMLVGSANRRRRDASGSAGSGLGDHPAADAAVDREPAEDDDRLDLTSSFEEDRTR